MSDTLPPDWKKSSIRELETEGAIELGRGMIISKKDIEAIPGDYPVYSSSASGSGEFGRYGNFMFDEELVTWSVDGGGKFFYRPHGKFSITNVSGYLRVTRKDLLDTYYTWAHLFGLWLHMTFNYTEKLHPSILRERFSFAYPPLPEQQRISKVLSTVQQAIEQQERLIRTTTELKQALMQKLFTEGLRGEAQKETEIGLVPESWEVVPLASVAKIERGKFSHRPRNDPRFYDGPYPFVQTGDVANCDGYVRSHSQSLNEAGLEVSRMFPAGTILITIAANIGFTGILTYPAACPDSLIGLTCGPKVQTEYFNYYLMTQQPIMDRLAPRGTQKNINIEFLKPWPVVLPPLDDQAAIADALMAVENRTRTAQGKRNTLQDLFRTLLHELMTGKVRVDTLAP